MSLMGDGKVVIPLIFGILILASFGLSQEVFAVDPKLYSISVNTDKLYIINPNNANSISDVTITLQSKVVKGSTGLATHPITGELYAILKTNQSNDRVLVKINPDTGVATSIGPMSLAFASITFNDVGVLFGITGWGDSFDNKSLYTINIINGVSTRICAIGTGNFGEAITFRTVDNLFYHGSGGGDSTDFAFFDKFDSDELNCNTTLINQNLSGLPHNFGEASAITWWPSQNVFLRAGGEPINDVFTGPYYLWKVPPDGSKPTLIGELDHKSKGLVLIGETLYSVTPYDSKFRTINTSTGATIDGNPAINLNGMAAKGTALAKNSLGTIYAMVSTGIGQGGNRTLVTLSETTPGVLWTANPVAQSNQRFSGLAFNAGDDLFGLTGESPQSDSLESIYQISAINGAESRKCGMGYGGFGEALGFNPNDGLMYRESGTEVKSFEKFDPTTHDCSTITPINLSDSTIGEPRALVYWQSEDAFIWSELAGTSVNPAPDILYKVLPDGAVTLIGTLDHDTKGLAFELIENNCAPLGSGDWAPSESCEMSGNATVNGNLILHNNIVLTIPNNVVLTVNGYVLVEILGGIYIVTGGGLNIIL